MLIRLWDAKSGNFIQDLRGQPGRVLGMSFLPDNKTLVVRSEDNSLRFLDARSGALSQNLPGRPGVLQFLPERGVVIRSSPTYALRFRDLDTSRPGATILLTRSGTQDSHLAVSADGHYHATLRLEQEVIVVAQTDHGQELFAPEEFAKKFQWKVDPDRVPLLGR
jgi:WD40 repeat protein